MGLVSHEAPRLTNRGPVPYDADDADRPLEAGMVVSVETTLLHPTRGFIKLEDTVVVTDRPRGLWRPHSRLEQSRRLTAISAIGWQRGVEALARSRRWCGGLRRSGLRGGRPLLVRQHIESLRNL